MDKRKILLIFVMGVLLIGIVSAEEKITDLKEPSNFILDIIHFITDIFTGGDTSLKVSGMKIINISVNGFDIDNLDYKSPEFNLKNSFDNKEGRIEQTINFKNNLNAVKTINISFLVEINYSEITWQGKRYELSEEPVMMKPYTDKETGNLVVPNIFFDDEFKKRINYYDLAQKGGYATAYKKDGKYYVELRIDNLNIGAKQEFYIDPTYINQTAGFSIVPLIGDHLIYGLSNDGGNYTSDNLDFHIINNGDSFVNHLKKDTGVVTNITDGFSIKTTGGDWQGSCENSSDVFVMNSAKNYIADYRKDGTNTSLSIRYSGDISGAGLACNYTLDAITDVFILDENTPKIVNLNLTGGQNGGRTNITIPTVFGATTTKGLSYNNSNFWFFYSGNISINQLDRMGTYVPTAINMTEFGGSGGGIKAIMGVNTTIYAEDTADKFVYEILCIETVSGDCPLFKYGTSVTYSVKVNLTSPINNYNSSISDVIFNCTGDAQANILMNISTWLNGIRTGTIINGINNFTSLQTPPVSLTDGSYNWTCEGVNNNSEIGWASNNRTLRVDTTAPIINSSSINRSVDYQIVNHNLTLNWSIDDLNPETCIVEYLKVNYTVACRDNNISLNMTDFYQSNITIYANDSMGNSAVDYRNWTYKVFQNEITYNPSTTEGSSENISLNFSKGGSFYISSVDLIYNGTHNHPSFVDSENQIVSKIITIPNVQSATNLSFYFQFNFSDSSSVLTSIYNQSVFGMGIDSCSSFTNQLFNITMKDEDSQNQLDGILDNTSVKLTFSISSLNKSLVSNYSNNFSYVNPVRICIEHPLSNISSYRLDGLIEYSSLNRFTEFYNFQNYVLSNITTNVSINLYNLNSTRGTSFKITYKDTNFVPVEDAIIQIQRKYVDEGIYKTTEIPKTGTAGYTIGHLVVNDVIYNLIIMREGNVLAIFSDIVAACQSPLIQDCQINLNELSSSVLPNSFVNTNDATFTMTFNKTTRNVDSIVAVPSGGVSTFLLNATLFDSLGNHSVCSDSFYGAGGELTCTVPSAFGNSTIVASLYKDGSLIGQSIISLNPNPSDIYGGSLIFIALFAIVMIIGIALTDNPMVFGLILGLGSIVMVALNIIFTPSVVGIGATILWFIVSLVLVLIKGSNRQ